MSTPARDDRTFDDLVREGLELLPVHAPEWTDHNPSDPGVTLVELLAYFTDALLFRIGRVTPAAKLQFLRLLKGSPDYDPGVPSDGGVADPGRLVDPAAELERAFAGALGEVAHMECAVTPADFERFALAVARPMLPGCPLCALCLANADLSGGRMHSAQVRSPGHVSVVVALPGHLSPHEAARVHDAVREDLETRLLLTTRLHVVAPVEVHVGIGFEVALLPGATMEAPLAGIREALRQRFEEALGQPLNLAAIARVIDAAPGVDYVERVTVLRVNIGRDVAGSGVGVQVGRVSKVSEDTRLGGPAALGEDRLVRDSEGTLASVVLRPWEQLRLSVASGDARVIEARSRARAPGRQGEGRDDRPDDGRRGGDGHV